MGATRVAPVGLSPPCRTSRDFTALAVPQQGWTRVPPATSLEVRAEARSELPRGAGGCVRRPTPSSVPGTRPTPGKAGKRGGSREGSQPREDGFGRQEERVPARDRAVWKKREKEETGAKRDSAPRAGAGAAADAAPPAAPTLVPAGRSPRGAGGCRATATAPARPPPPRGPCPPRTDTPSAPLRPAGTRAAKPRPPPAPLPRSGRATRREGTAAPAGAPAAAAAGTCWAGRLFIAAGSGAARLWGAAPPPPPRRPRPRRAGGGRALSAGPGGGRGGGGGCPPRLPRLPGSRPPAGGPGPARPAERGFPVGWSFPGGAGVMAKAVAPPTPPPPPPAPAVLLSQVFNGSERDDNQRYRERFSGPQVPTTPTVSAGSFSRDSARSDPPRPPGHTHSPHGQLCFAHPLGLRCAHCPAVPQGRGALRPPRSRSALTRPSGKPQRPWSRVSSPRSCQCSVCLQSSQHAPFSPPASDGLDSSQQGRGSGAWGTARQQAETHRVA